MADASGLNPTMSVVLAVEPDSGQTTMLRQIFRERSDARLHVVTSKSAALAALRQEVPDLVLLSALLSPPDEEEVVAHLRSLEGAAHLQTLSIPQLRAPAAPPPAGGFFRRRKRHAQAPDGCDPKVFADQVSAYLTWAREIRGADAADLADRADLKVRPYEDTLTDVGSSDLQVRLDDAPEDAEEEIEISLDELLRPESSPVQAISDAELEAEKLEAAELERTLREAAECERAREEAARHRQALEEAAQRERAIEKAGRRDREVQAAAQRERELEEAMQRERALEEAAQLERVRAAAAERRIAELARFQAEAEAVREAAVEQARAAAELEAREALARELARMRAEAQQTFVEALTRVRSEAAHTVAAEVTRARQDAERIRLTELARVQGEAETRLQTELDRMRVEAEQLRARERVEAIREAEQIRESAVHDARTAAEHAATSTLRTEIERVRAEADARLSAELARVAAEADQRRDEELESIRAQVADVREAAAQHARAAARQAIEAPRPRVLAVAAAEADAPRFFQSPEAKWSMPAMVTVTRRPAPARTSGPGPVAAAGRQEATRSSGSYYTLWNASQDAVRAGAPAWSETRPSRRRTHWKLPIAASILLFVSSGGVAIDTAYWPSTPWTLMGPPVELKTPAAASPRKKGGVSSPARTAAALPGWLAVFSRIPLQIQVDGRVIGSTDDGQLMLPAGRHRVTLISEHYQFRQTETLHVRSGFVTSHTVRLPTATVHVLSAQGAEIWVEGERVGEAPARGLAVTIGTREIMARHPELGERREIVEVRAGDETEVTLELTPQ